MSHTAGPTHTASIYPPLPIPPQTDEAYTHITFLVKACKYVPVFKRDLRAGTLLYTSAFNDMVHEDSWIGTASYLGLPINCGYGDGTGHVYYNRNFPSEHHGGHEYDFLSGVDDDFWTLPTPTTHEWFLCQKTESNNINFTVSEELGRKACFVTVRDVYAGEEVTLPSAVTPTPQSETYSFAELVASPLSEHEVSMLSAIIDEFPTDNDDPIDILDWLLAP